jgi:SAM-dependent methyltransferase
MWKYYLAALSLKMLSSCSISRNLYRNLGNTLGAQKRATGLLPTYYKDRVKRLLDSIKKYGFLGEKSRILELGTGWMHWEAITARLFYDFKATLFDVWDNRQLQGLKNSIMQLKSFLPSLDIDDSLRERAYHMINRISTIACFEELYKLLEFTYEVSPGSILNVCEKNCYDAVLSAGVMEHVYKNQLPHLLSDLKKLLKPDGYSIHSINLRDHLRQYARSASSKQYLKYSDRHWNRWLQNDVQYINRIQRPEWIKLFENAGYVLVDEECERDKLSINKVSDTFKTFCESDLQVTWIKLVHINGCPAKAVSNYSEIEEKII